MSSSRASFDARTVASESGVPVICSECYMYCNVRAEVKGGRVVRIHGDPNDPVYRGGLCNKGFRAVELAYSPARVLHPMKKVGARDSGRWEQISWLEALTTIADNFERIIRQHGPGSIVAFTGFPATSRCMMATLFARSLGTPNHVATTPLWCEGPGMVADHVTYGAPVSHYTYHDIDHTQCLLLWGTNPHASHPPFWRRVLDARRRGAKLIVVDPNRTPAAARADVWLQVRPGTDAALALAMAHVIIGENLYDSDFVSRWCHGFDALKAHVQKYPPARAAELTGVPADLIVKAAHLYGGTKPACLFARDGITRKPNATQTCRAVTMLIALTGNVDIAGGNLLPQNAPGFVSRGEMLFSKAWRLPEHVEAEAYGAQDFPLWTGPKGVGATGNNSYVAQEMLRPQSRIKAGIFVGSNFALNSPDPNAVVRGLKNLDFAFAVDLFLTPTTELADIFLPAAAWFEHDDIGSELLSLWISAGAKAVEPQGEARSDDDIFIELANMMRKRGLLPYDFMKWDSAQAYYDYRLKGLGMTFRDLQHAVRIPMPVRQLSYVENGFATPTKKVELYSTLFEAQGHAPLPDFEELPESPVSTPELEKEYPLILITPREGTYFNSRGRQSPSLRKMHREPRLGLHPDTAAKLRVKTGDRVWIETRKGKCKQTAMVTDGVLPNVASAESYWWYPDKPAPDYGRHDGNISELIPDGAPYDPIEGTPWLVGRLCRVRKAEV